MLRFGPAKIYLIGCILIFISVVFSPSFVASYLSPDGVLLESTIKILGNFRIVTICLGIFTTIFGILTTRWPKILYRASGLLDSKLILAVIFLIFLLYFLAVMKFWICVDDEGYVAYSATKILNGKIPYRDFWANNAPGQFYAVAFLFKIFGPSIITLRAYTAIVRFLIVILVFWIVKKLTSQRLALLSCFLVAICIETFDYYHSYPLAPTVVFGLFSCLCLVEFISKKKKWILTLAGILTGIATLFRHDFGACLFLAESATIIPFTYINLSQGENCRMKKLLKSLQIYSRYLAGALITVLPFAIFFIYNVPIRELVFDLFTFGIVTYSKFYRLPYLQLIPTPVPFIAGEQKIFHYIIEYLHKFPYYFLPIVFAITVISLTSAIHKRKNISEKDWFVILFFLLSAALSSIAIYAPTLLHLLPAIIPATILLSLLLFNLGQKEAARGHYGIRSFVCCLIFLVMLSFGCIFFNDRVLPLLFATDLVPLDLNRARGIYGSREEVEHLQQAVRFIQRHVPENERIFVCSPRNQKIGGNNITFYFLSERQSATKHYYLLPHMLTRGYIHIQKEIINDLIKHKVNYIIIWHIKYLNIKPSWYEEDRIPELDDFIKHNYRKIKTFGNYTILHRNFK